MQYQRATLFFLVVLFCCSTLIVAYTHVDNSRSASVLYNSHSQDFRAIDKKIEAHKKWEFYSGVESGDGSTSSQAAGRKYVPMETAKGLHARDDIRQVKRADRDANHEVIFVVKHKNLDKLEEILQDVSDPFSRNYGKYMTHSEVEELTVNSPSLEYVLKYLRFQGIDVSMEESVNAGQFVTAQSSVLHWENMFNTHFYEYEHDTSSGSNAPNKFIRALEYSLPEELVGHVGAVFNTVQFLDPNSLKKRNPTTRTQIQPLKDGSTSTIIDIPEGYVTPQRFNEFYGITSNTGSQKASQGVFETIDQSMSPSDLTAFQRQFKLPIESVAEVIGGHSYDDACVYYYGADCVEANLDIQWLMGIAQNTPSTYYYYSSNDFVLGWIQTLAKSLHPALVYSISYGIDEVYLPDSYGAEFDVQAMKLGVQGVTIVVSSGDDGAISSNGRYGFLYCGYQPSFPATSPYVVAVGGTMGPEYGNSEVACQGDLGGVITTGGGFSTYVDMPSYQADAVNAYWATVEGNVKTGTAPYSGYNRAGRGYPDISALAHNYIVAVNGNLEGVSGTSASAPAIAAMISLVNSARMDAGKSSLGWITPALYALSSSFVNDITVGNNLCVADGLVCCAQGYFAGTGWDPVTGLGSINFPKFKDTFVALGDNYLYPTFQPTEKGQAPIKPTKSPTNKPPTVAPTYSAGWIQIKSFDGEDCEEGPEVTAVPSTVNALPTDVCLVEYEYDHSTIVGSRKYYCADGLITIDYFYGSSCTAKNIIGRDEYVTGCANVRENDDYYESVPYDYVSASITCGAGKDIPSSLPQQSSLPFAVHKYYDSKSGCGSESSLSGYDAYREQTCFAGSSSSSYMFNNNVLLEYTNTRCHGDPYVKLGLPTTCTETADDFRYDMVYDDYFYYSNTRRKLDSSSSSSSLSDKEQQRRQTLEQEEEEEEEEEEVLSYDYYYYYYLYVGDTELYNLWASLINPLADGLPTLKPSGAPHTQVPSARPVTRAPTFTPSTRTPTLQPSTLEPSRSPSDHPTILPTYSPTDVGEASPSQRPTTSTGPTVEPSLRPSIVPSLKPTLKPSFQPTLKPSGKPSSVATISDDEEEEENKKFEFSVIQVLYGIDSALFLGVNNVAENKKVLSNAASEAMSYTEANDIEIKWVVDAPPQNWLVSSAVGAAAAAGDHRNTADSMGGHRQEDSLRGLAVEGLECYVNYTVRYQTSVTKLTPEDSFVILSNSLMNAIHDQSFDSSINSFAKTFKAVYMEGVTTTRVKVSDTYNVYTASSSDANEGGTATNGPRDTGLMIAIVLILASAAIGGMCWMSCGIKKTVEDEGGASSLSVASRGGGGGGGGGGKVNRVKALVTKAMTPGSHTKGGSTTTKYSTVQGMSDESMHAAAAAAQVAGDSRHGHTSMRSRISRYFRGGPSEALNNNKPMFTIDTHDDDLDDHEIGNNVEYNEEEDDEDVVREIELAQQHHRERESQQLQQQQQQRKHESGTGTTNPLFLSDNNSNEDTGDV